jgi:hypothetical protein
MQEASLRNKEPQYSTHEAMTVGDLQKQQAESRAADTQPHSLDEM